MRRTCICTVGRGHCQFSSKWIPAQLLRPPTLTENIPRGEQKFSIYRDNSYIELPAAVAYLARHLSLPRSLAQFSTVAETDRKNFFSSYFNGKRFAGKIEGQCKAKLRNLEGRRYRKRYYLRPAEAGTHKRFTEI